MCHIVKFPDHITPKKMADSIEITLGSRSRCERWLLYDPSGRYATTAAGEHELIAQILPPRICR
jgi:hypothetical protein